MPLFIVRWAGLHASLVSARDEQDLLNVLDQVDDPGACTYQRYTGPVWVDFEIPFDATRTTPDVAPAASVHDYTVEPTAEYRGAMTLTDMRLEVPLCDWGLEMLGNVTQVAFPHLREWLEEQDDSGMEEEGREASEVPEHFPATLRAALVSDLEPLVRHSQASAAVEARTDHEAQVMKSMNVTVIPPSWREPDEDQAGGAPEREDIGLAIASLAGALAGTLGVSTDAVVEALLTPEANMRLGELFATIAAAAARDDDGSDFGMHSLRISSARGLLSEVGDGHQ